MLYGTLNALNERSSTAMKRSIKPLLAALLLFGATTAAADTLLMETINTTPKDLARPTTGQSMDQVKSRYGKPSNILPAVGDPPITRWVYADFTVYFEHKHVINSVVHPKEKEKKEDKK
jgi:hypothetical protein